MDVKREVGWEALIDAYEATRVSAMQHGQPKYATHGFGTLQKSELRRRLRMMIEAGELRHDTYLTVRELAVLRQVPG